MHMRASIRHIIPFVVGLILLFLIFSGIGNVIQGYVTERLETEKGYTLRSPKDEWAAALKEQREEVQEEMYAAFLTYHHYGLVPERPDMKPYFEYRGQTDLDKVFAYAKAEGNMGCYECYDRNPMTILYFDDDANDPAASSGEYAKPLLLSPEWNLQWSEDIPVVHIPRQPEMKALNFDENKYEREYENLRKKYGATKENPFAIVDGASGNLVGNFGKKEIDAFQPQDDVLKAINTVVRDSYDAYWKRQSTR